MEKETPYHQCCGAGAAAFRVSPEPIILLAEAESRSRLFKAPPAPAASFWQANKKSLAVVTKHDLRAFIPVNVIQKRLALIIHFLLAQYEKCLSMEPEPPSLAWSRSRPVPAPQHCL